ncbi:MAG: DegT/DnrJ/EryC1/StrS family aminotransferase [Smithella sp.]
MNITAPKFDDDEIHLLKQCLNSGWVTQGPLVDQFEQTFAHRHQVAHALATTSCTAALHLAMLALGIGPGDEVIVPAFTWVTSAHCAEYVGARVVFADVEPDTFNLDPRAFEAAITERTKAVVVVHLFGLSAKMDEIMEIARRNNLSVIEDAACAIGTTYNNQPVGVIGDVGCFSFHPRKIITTGEGGMVTTNRDDIALKIKSLRNHGATGPPPGIDDVTKPYVMATFNNLGFNLRLSDIQAAVGVAQMAKLDELLEERLANAIRYNELLSEINEIATPFLPDHCCHTYQSYVIRLLQGGMKRRNAIMDFFSFNRIQTRPGTHAVHRLGYYARKYNIRSEEFPNAALCEDTTITLPIFPGMTESDQVFVKDTLIKALKTKDNTTC